MKNLISSLRAVLLPLALALVSASPSAYAKSEEKIDAKVDAALVQFRKEVKGADDYLKGAAGVLVFPGVKKVGLVVGGQGGEGALRVQDKSVAYYNLSAASVGLQAGYQEANFVFLFLTKEAMDKFTASNGWTAGVDGGITVVDSSVGMNLDTLKAQNPVVAFAYGRKGLMAGWSAKGMKFTKREDAKVSER